MTDELSTLKAQLAEAKAKLASSRRCERNWEANSDAWRRIANEELTPKLEASEQRERELRELLWLRHGCSLNRLYGDDGEMQCADCLLDFKRDSLEEISERWKTLGQKALEAALRSVPPSTQDYKFAGSSPAPVLGAGLPEGTLVAGSHPASEQVPAASVSGTEALQTGRQTNVVASHDRQFESGPQDSPSRSEWISVEERLPEDSGMKLIWVIEAGAPQFAWEEIGFFRVYKDNKWCRMEGLSEIPDYENVTHWQPLPAPPSRASEKENRK